MSNIPKDVAVTGRSLPQPGKGFNFGDGLAFSIPFLRFVQLKVVGTLSGSDILIVIVFLGVVVARRLKIKSRGAKTLLILCSLWLLSQVVTDVVRRTAFADYARGWSNIGFTLATFAVLLTILYGRTRRLVLYGWGLVIGGLLTYWIAPDEYMKGDPWKFGLSFPVTWAVMLFASRKQCRGYWPIMLATAVGMLNIWLGARSIGAFCLVAAIYLFATRMLRKRTRGAVKLKVRFPVAIVASLLLSGIGIIWAYSYAASTGLLGEDAQQKYELQSGGKYGLLLGGRVETLGSIPAIYASPILGHGSWARDPLYVFMEERGLAMLGYNVKDNFDPEVLRAGYIPTHSYIFGAWVDAGILGAVFWGWVFILAARALSRVYPINAPLVPFAAFAGFWILWDVLFSPYGAEMRIITPYYLVLLMTCMSIAPGKPLKETGDAIGRPESVASAFGVSVTTSSGKEMARKRRKMRKTIKRDVDIVRGTS